MKAYLNKRPKQAGQLGTSRHLWSVIKTAGYQNKVLAVSITGRPIIVVCTLLIFIMIEFTSKCRNPRNKEELIISYESALKLGGLGIGLQIFGNPTLLQRIKQKAESLPNQFLQKKVKSPNSNKNKNQQKMKNNKVTLIKFN